MTATPQVITTEGEAELVVLTRRAYDALRAAAGDEDAELRVTDRIVREGRAAINRGDEVVVPDWLAFGTADGTSAVKVVREHQKLLQFNVAHDAGISQGYLSDIEKGRRKPTAEVLAKIGAAMAVDPAWLE